MLDNIKNALMKIINNIKNRLTTDKRWKLKIYYYGQLVKTVKVDEHDKPLGKVYVCSIWFRKHIFKAIHATVVLVPMKVLYANKDKRETHVESILYEGDDLS